MSSQLVALLCDDLLAHNRICSCAVVVMSVLSGGTNPGWGKDFLRRALSAPLLPLPSSKVSFVTHH